jgi:phosphoheptose isomerase
MSPHTIPNDLSAEAWLQRLAAENTQVGEYFAHLLARDDLGEAAVPLARAFTAITNALARGNTLYLCGNGGSLSDALHISGEMLKSFKMRRPLPGELAARLRAEPMGNDLAEQLQSGLRAHVLGINPALGSAVNNDIPLAGALYAQELIALGRQGDVLMGISTSGGAMNVRLAVSVAKALGMATIGLTGQAPNPLAEQVHIAISVPVRETYCVQELHLVLYHQLCLMLEAHFFGG